MLLSGENLNFFFFSPPLYLTAELSYNSVNIVAAL